MLAARHRGLSRRRRLAKKKIPVSLTLVDSPGGKPEAMGLLEENAAILDKAGVRSPSTPTTSSPSRASPAHRRHRRPRRHDRGGRAQGADAHAGEDAAPRRPPRLAGEGQGRRLRGPLRRRRSASTRRCCETYIDGKKVFDRDRHATGPTRPAASRCRRADELPTRSKPSTAAEAVARRRPAPSATATPSRAEANGSPSSPAASTPAAGDAIDDGVVAGRGRQDQARRPARRDVEMPGGRRRCSPPRWSRRG